MTIWQWIGLPVCLGLWLLIAVANIDAVMGLAPASVLFSIAGFDVTVKHAYAIGSASVDGALAVSAVAVAWQWTAGRRGRAAAAGIAWAICAAISWHSLWLWFGANHVQVKADASQSRDIYAVTQAQIKNAQKGYEDLTQRSTHRMGPKTLTAYRQSVQAAEERLDWLRAQLAGSQIRTASVPVAHFDLLGATLLLILNTVLWVGLYGPRRPRHGSAQKGTDPGTLPAQISGTESVPPAQMNENKDLLCAAPASEERTKMDNSGQGGTQVVPFGTDAARSIRLWLRRHTSTVPGGFASVPDLFKNYAVYGTVDMTAREFGALLKAELKCERRSRKVNGKSTWGYDGLVILEANKSAPHLMAQD